MQINDKTEFERKLDESAGRDAVEDISELGESGGEIPCEIIDPETQPESPVDEHTVRLEQEVEYLKDQLLRARAEFDNFRKRTARENERIRKTAAEGIIRALVPVMDNLGLALEHADGASSGVAQGVAMVLTQMNEALRQNGLSPIVAAGERFDPNIHEAVAQMNSDSVQADYVVHEFQRGYRLGDLVLRPSRVAVSTGPAIEAQPLIEEE